MLQHAYLAAHLEGETKSLQSPVLFIYLVLNNFSKK